MPTYGIFLFFILVLIIYLFGVAKMVVTFGDQLRDEIFKEKVGFMSVRQLSRIAKERGAGSLGYAEAMLVAYNRKCKYTLRMTKLHSSKAAVEEDSADENEALLKDNPVLEDQTEIHLTQSVIGCQPG